MRRALEPGTLALAVADSGNEKIGDAATTYAAQVSCPSDCVFFDGGGCYAEDGPLGKFITQPLNRAADAGVHHPTPESVATAEAEALDAMHIRIGQPLRLHTVGDCATNESARIVADAAQRYRERGGGAVWTYTHGWRRVRRESWDGIVDGAAQTSSHRPREAARPVSVLASCETGEDVALARSRGYATAMVVEEFQSDKLYEIENRPGEQAAGAGGGVGPRQALTGAEHGPDDDATACLGVSSADSPPGRTEPGAARPSDLDNRDRQVARPAGPSRAPGSVLLLPCPAQTRDVPCSKCRLCFDDTRLREAGITIGFAIHGTRFLVRKARLALSDPDNPNRKRTLRELIPEFETAFISEHGREPSNREIAEALDYTESSVWEMRKSLRTGKPTVKKRYRRRPT